MGRLQVFYLNFDDPKNKAAIQPLHVVGHPSIVLIDRKGVAQAPLLGAQSDAKLRPQVAALVGQ